MYTLGISTICHDLSPLMRLIGEVLNIFKIALPLILIALGILDIGKAVISNKPDDIKKYFKSLVKKIIAIVVTFFLPTIVNIIFGFVEGFNSIKENSGIDYDVCYNCMFYPNSNSCIEITSKMDY